MNHIKVMDNLDALSRLNDYRFSYYMCMNIEVTRIVPVYCTALQCKYSNNGLKFSITLKKKNHHEINFMYKYITPIIHYFKT